MLRTSFGILFSIVILFDFALPTLGAKEMYKGCPYAGKMLTSDELVPILEDHSSWLSGALKGYAPVGIAAGLVGRHS